MKRILDPRQFDTEKLARILRDPQYTDPDLFAPDRNAPCPELDELLAADEQRMWFQNLTYQQRRQVNLFLYGKDTAAWVDPIEEDARS